MAIHLTNNPTTRSAFGSALSQALGNIAQQKVAQMEQRSAQDNNVKILEANGFSPEQAQLISSYAPKEQLQLLQQIAPANIRPQQNALQQFQQQSAVEQPKILPQTIGPNLSAPETAQDIIRKGLQPQKPSDQQNPVQQIKQLSRTNVAPTYEEEAEAISRIEKAEKPVEKSIKEASKQKRILEHAEKKQAEQLKKEVQKIEQPKPLLTNALERKAQLDREKEERAAARENEKLSRIEQHEANKETKPFYDEVTKAARAAKDNDKRLNRMEKLIERGNLSNPTAASVIDKLSKGIWGFGIDLTALQHPDSQEFKKLSADFVKNAKEIFGNRLTDTDIKVFMETVPTLMQSNGGKIRVINNLRSFNQAIQIRKSAMDDIIKENGGNRPRNLDMLVEDRVGDQLEALSDQFTNQVDQYSETKVGSTIRSILPF